jgi:zinc protease
LQNALERRLGSARNVEVSTWELALETDFFVKVVGNPADSEMLPTSSTLAAMDALATTGPSDDEVDARICRASPRTSGRSRPTASVTATARPTEGLASDLPKITRDRVIEWWDRALVASSVSLAVVGDVSAPAVLASAERVLVVRASTRLSGAQRAHAARPTVREEVDTKAALRPGLVFVSKPKSEQAYVHVARPAFGWNAEDRFAGFVENRVLGKRAFSSRLNRVLREEKGATYWAWSTYAPRPGGGPFLAGAAVYPAKVGEAIRALRSEFARMGDEPVTEGELTAAKRAERLAVVAGFESTGDGAEVTGGSAERGAPAAEYVDWLERNDLVSAADVQRTARAYLDSSKMVWVVVGDESVVMPQRREFGPVRTVVAPR